MTYRAARGMTDGMIYKIVRREEWDELQSTGSTVGSPVDVADGFIHFSTAAQLRETAARHFAGEEGLVLLGIDEKTLGDALKWEPSRGGALFPHLYRRLATVDVVSAHRIGSDGPHHVFPEFIP